MDFQFVLPTTNADLLNSDGNNYFVKQVHNHQNIPELLRGAKNAFTSSDPFYIFDHFDTFFSMIENASNLTIINLIRANDLLYITIDSFGQLLTTYLQNNETTNRNSYLNLTKMVMFLSIGIIKSIDEQIIKQTQSDGPMAGGGQTKKAGGGGRKHTAISDTIDIYEWDGKKFKFLLQLYNFIQLPLERLWNQSMVEENFVNLICNLCYKTLEQTTIRDKRINDVIFQIFGTAIKRFNHAITFPIRILQILRTSECAINSIANGVTLLYEEFEITTIFSVLLKDLIDTMSLDAADTQTLKNFSNFLSEIGLLSPKLIIPHLSTMAEELLNLESYVLRNCILQIMGDVIVRELSSEELSDDLRETRDEFLEGLLDHIEDISAHVRSKVLQIWNHLKIENAIPLAFQHKVLQLTVERLDDKGSLVRKNAIILVKSFLERNPFASKLSLEELKKQYDTEVDKLETIRKDIIECERKITERNDSWQHIFPDILPIIEETFSQSSTEQLDSQEQCHDIVEKINTLLEEKKYREAVQLLKIADFVAGTRDERVNMPFEQQCAYYAALLKSYLFIGIQDFTEVFATQNQTVKFLNDSIIFSETIASAVPKIENILMSKINTDVFESIDFFTTAFLFGIEDTKCGMHKILCLVWSSDKEKRDGATQAFHRVLFVTDKQGKAHSMQVVDNLCNFLENINDGHFQALEVLMNEWIDATYIDNNIIQVLFERFTLKISETTSNSARLALQLIISASNGKPTIATANIDLILSIGLGERGLRDSRIYVGCLQILMNLAPQTSTKYHKRYDPDSEIIKNITETFKKLIFFPQIQNIDKIVSTTFDFIYHMCTPPDILCRDIIVYMCKKVQEIGEKFAITSSSVSASSENPIISGDTIGKIPAYLLSNILLTVGYVAMKEMIHLDIDIYNNLKYREQLKEEKKSNKNKTNKRNTNHNNTTANTTVNMSASNALKRLSGTAAEPQQEPDEMLEGATAEDSIADLITDINENILLYSPDGILGKFIPLIMEILKHPGVYVNERLQQTSSLTLIRFMSISARFCADNMSFLVNILNKTKNIKIKCNIVIGLSDLTFRFPNVIEPYTSSLYLTLHEQNDEVRLTAVKILSHLILHEMIRVKGQISDLALCIVDANEKIRNITKQFFKDISQKSNILYNVLPDIISRLSDVNNLLEEERYHVIMKYIIGLIQKDRQVESLVEKLCLRFRVTNEERQWRDIAYCLSLLNYTEKTIKKLIDHIQNFKDKVQIDEVYDSFKTIISQTMKLAKPELKTIVTEFETKLNECLSVDQINGDDGGGSSAGDGDGNNPIANGNLNNSGINMPPPSQQMTKRLLRKQQRGTKVTAKNKKSQQPSTRKKPTRKDSDGSTESDEEDDDDDVFERNHKTRDDHSTSTRSSTRIVQRSRRVVTTNNSSSSEEESETQTQTQSTSRGKKRAKTTK